MSLLNFYFSWYWFLTSSRYEEAKAKGTDNYDRDLEDVIDRLIVECDRKIARALKRLEDEDAKAAIAISVSEVTQVMLLFGCLCSVESLFFSFSIFFSF